MLILDWGTKWLVQKHIIQAVEEIPIIPGFFYLRHDRNDGAAFGVLAGHRFFAYPHYHCRVGFHFHLLSPIQGESLDAGLIRLFTRRCYWEFH